MAISPREQQIAELLDRDQGGSINMLNLLKFRHRADYADGRDAQLTGREAYMRYAEQVGKLVADLGGEFVFASDANTLVIGDGELQWDMVAIVKYPSVAAFLQMTESADYAEIHVHREAGLAHQLLVQC